MNWMPSGGLPNTNSIDGRNLMSASAASFDWSISEKNLMPLVAISALMRMIASCIGTALLTRTMPSSLSARAEEMIPVRKIASNIGMNKFARWSVKRRVIGVSCRLGACQQHAFERQDGRSLQEYEMRKRSEIDSRPLYRPAMPRGYRTDRLSVFPKPRDPAFDGATPDRWAV